MPKIKQTPATATVAVAPKTLPPRPKALRADLEKRKTALERKSWKFNLTPDDYGYIAAEKHFKYEAKPIRIGTFKPDEIGRLLNAVENHQSDMDSLGVGKYADQGEAKTESAEIILSAADTVVEIEVSNIVPSGFEPQARRRSHFKPEEIEELGNSIASPTGLIIPIIVRPAPPPSLPRDGETKGEYEIVSGERRWRAHILQNLPTIKCLVRDLSDELALVVQMKENLERKGVDPLDEAFSYKYYLDHTDHTVADLAVMFGVSKQFIRRRLKFNDLIAEALAEIEAGNLPLGHAEVIARYPAESQKIIVEQQMAYRFGDRSDGVLPLAEFKTEIETEIVRRLKNAPFDTEDPRLRLDGLICPNCPQRSHFEPTLFADDFDDDDRCLNQKCFQFKTDVHLRLQREEIALKTPNPENKPIDEIVKKVPLVTEKSWASDDATPFKEKLLTGQKFLPEPECEYSQLALITDGERKGQQTYICNDGHCKIHHDKSAAKTEETPDWKLKQQEEDFNRQVAARVRENVFAVSIEFFDEYKPVWMYADLVERLLVEFLFSVHILTRQMIFKILSTHYENAPTDFHSREQAEKFVAALEARGQSQMLFLLMFQSEGLYSTAAHDGLKKLAKSYACRDYALFDAEARLALAPEEFKPVADSHLQRVKDGHRENPPRFWWTEPEASQE